MIQLPLVPVSVFTFSIALLTGGLFAEPNDTGILIPEWKNGDRLHVFSPHGLYMYSTPCSIESGCEAHISAFVPAGTLVTFEELAANDTAPTNYGIKAPLAKVRWGKQVGFLFSGLLSRMRPAPRKCSNLHEYVLANFGKPKKVWQENWCVSPFGEHCGRTMFSLFENGVIHGSDDSSGVNGPDEHFEEIVNLTNSLHDAFLLALNCGPLAIRTFDFSAWSYDSSGWYLTSGADTMCDIKGKARNPVVSVKYRMRVIENDNSPSRIRIERSRRISDLCR